MLLLYTQTFPTRSQTSLEYDRGLKWFQLVAADHFWGFPQLLAGFVVSLVMSQSNPDLLLQLLPASWWYTIGVSRSLFGNFWHSYDITSTNTWTRGRSMLSLQRQIRWEWCHRLNWSGWVTESHIRRNTGKYNEFCDRGNAGLSWLCCICLFVPLVMNYGVIGCCADFKMI